MTGVGPAGTSRLRRRSGFALLAALVIVALVMVAVVGLLAVTSSRLSVSGADHDALRARMAAEEGIAATAEAIRWSWMSPPDTLRGPALTDGTSYEVTVDGLAGGAWSSQLAEEASQRSGVTTDSVRLLRVSSVGRGGSAVRRIETVLTVTPDALPRGLAVEGDAVLDGRLELVGCGLYAGGDVRGREHVVLSTQPSSATTADGELPDLAYGGFYATAGVHAGGAIFRGGVEVHDPGGGAVPSDDDRHTSAGPPAKVTAPTPRTLQAGLAAHATSPGVALAGDGALSVHMIPVTADDGPTSAGDGRILVLTPPAGGRHVSVVGDRDQLAGACALTLVVAGDCLLGSADDPGATTSFRGALVVAGTLTVVGPAQVTGGVRAATLDVRAPFTVATAGEADDAGKERAPGASNVQSAAWSE